MRLLVPLQFMHHSVVSHHRTMEGSQAWEKGTREVKTPIKSLGHYSYSKDGSLFHFRWYL